MQRFKNVLVAKNSELGAALEKGDRKLAEKIHAETTDRYKKLYPQADREWLDSFSPS